MLDSDTNMGARTDAINGTPGHAGPHEPNHAEGPWGSSSPMRARSCGRPWRLDGRAVDVLWIEGVSARFETVSGRIREKDFDNASFDDSYRAWRFDVNSSKAEGEMRVPLPVVSSLADLERSFSRNLATDAKDVPVISNRRGKSERENRLLGCIIPSNWEGQGR